jgi:thioredoxin-dependent peroxiredoxin
MFILLSLLTLIQPPQPVSTQLPVPTAQRPLEKPDGEMIKLLGKMAPAFKLLNQDNKIVSLSSAKGKWLVLAFYPADMTQGGILQNKSYSDNLAFFASHKAVIWAISTQNLQSKQLFKKIIGLNNTLLADTEAKISKEYKVINKENNLAMRATFYIDPDGKIVYIDTNVNVKTAAIDALGILARLQKKN